MSERSEVRADTNISRRLIAWGLGGCVCAGLLVAFLWLDIPAAETLVSEPSPTDEAEQYDDIGFDATAGESPKLIEHVVTDLGVPGPMHPTAPIGVLIADHGPPRTLPAAPGVGGGEAGGVASGMGHFGGRSGATRQKMLFEGGGAAPALHNTEAYDRIVDNSFRLVSRDPLSTFSVDVDTASYSNLRRHLNSGRLPPKDAVRIEEMINYFKYNYPEPEGETPVSINTELTECPWKPAHRLLRIGLQGKRIDPKQLPARNLVFLLDVSGSMRASNKLPLVKQSMKLLVDQLDKNDRVAIVVYAGSSGLVLPATPGSERDTILDALNRLQAGGSTNGGQGIQLAYKVAQENFIKNGVNRVILATDGDFNVGVTNQGDLLRLIEDKRASGVFLTILGYGMGNLKDSTMEKLADHGNGHYAYIDTLAEARKVFVEEGAALVTIAKDVKLQLEFNPQHVRAYRLIGYENRLLKKEDFNNDKKDAGDIGSGHCVTALYELVPTGIEFDLPRVDKLKYQKPLEPTKGSDSDEALTVKLRYKEPAAETSELISHPVGRKMKKLADASDDQRWAAAVAALGMMLRDSPYQGDVTFTLIRELAEKSRGQDKHAHRAEFIKLIDQASSLKQPTKDVR